ncbi:MAG: DNA polymerase III subunit delta' [Gammaproteobacteria bacterium]|jgi:DNA polymerase-3 subunit delta'
MADLYPWLEPYRESLAAVMRQGRLPHALLLSGLPGMGKGAFADYLARMLLCESPSGKDAGPCDRCPGCVQLTAGSHPDFFRVGIEDEATAIKVDQVRELSRRLGLSSHRGGYKVAVMDPAEAMNVNAANSLLKTLEEPADNTVVVLVSAFPARLSATIRSRCQHVRIDTTDRDAARRWLATQIPPGEAVAVYLQLANGAPLEARHLAEADVIAARRTCFQALVGILDGNSGSLSLAQEWCRNEELREVGWLREWLMDLLRIRMTGHSGGVRSVDLLEELESLAPRLDSRIMFGQLERINRVMRMAAGSLNRQLMTEDLLLAWAAQG